MLNEKYIRNMIRYKSCKNFKNTLFTFAIGNNFKVIIELINEYETSMENEKCNRQK